MARRNTFVTSLVAGMAVALFAVIGCSYNPFGATEEDETVKDAKNMIIPLQEGNTWVYEYKKTHNYYGLDTTGKITIKIQSIIKDSNNLSAKISFIDSGVYIQESTNPKGTVWTVDTSWYIFSNQTLLSGGDTLVWDQIRTLLAFEKQRDTQYYYSPWFDTYDSLLIVSGINTITFNSSNRTLYRQVNIQDWSGHHAGEIKYDTTLWIENIGLYRKGYVHIEKMNGFQYTRHYQLISFYSENPEAFAMIQKPA